MGEILLAIFFGWLFGSGGKLPRGGGGVQPIPPGKQPHPAPAPGKKPPPAPAPDEPIVPPPNTPGYEQPDKPKPSSSEPKPEPVPNAYKPPGGWEPYLTAWTVQRATYLLKHPDELPTGSSKLEVDPKGVQVKFRAESGKAHGDPNLKRAVTAWRKT